jgi:hypothetical protein
MATLFKQVKNNAKSVVLPGALNNEEVTLTFSIDSGTGDLFPMPGNGFYVTAWNNTVYFDPSDDPNMRIGLCTARDGVGNDDLTVTWGQLGTGITAMPGTPMIALLVLDQYLNDIHSAINALETAINNVNPDSGVALLNVAQTFSAAHTFNARTFLDKGNMVYDVKAYGAVGNGIQLADGAITAASAILTSATASFSVGDIGKLVTVVGAGTAGANLNTTIADYTSSTTVTLSAVAVSTVSGAKVTYGTDDTDYIHTALQAVLSTNAYNATLYLSPGMYMFKPQSKNISGGSATASSTTITAPSSFFIPQDVGKSITVGGAGVAGGNLSATVATYISPTQVTLSVAASTSTVGTSAFTLSVNQFLIATSGVKIIGAGYTRSKIVTMGSGQTNGTFTVDAAGKQLEDIEVAGFTVDVNNQTSIQGLTFKGGNYATGDYLKHLNIHDMRIFGTRTVDFGHIHIYSGRGSTDRGLVSDINIHHNLFDASSKFHFYVSGYANDVTIQYNRFINSAAGCIAWNTQSKTGSTNSSIRSGINWDISYNYFNNNILTDFGAAIGMIHDANRQGVRSMRIHHNFFDGKATDFQQFCMHIHSAWGLNISDNVFWKVRTIMAIGASTNGDYYKTIPDLFGRVSRNLFYKPFNICDHDSVFFGMWDQNVFYEVEFSGLGETSRHFPSQFTGNILYNISNYTGGDASAHTGFQTHGDGCRYENNTFIDDRLLPDPDVAPVLSDIAGGALSSRTYYVRYHYENDTGITASSPEVSRTVAANRRLTVAHPYTSNQKGIPFGTKKVWVSVGTAVDSEVIQDYVPTPWHLEIETDHATTGNTITYTEPLTGVVAGATNYPTVNTTAHLMLYGIYEIGGANQTGMPSHYENNHFYGITTPIFFNSSYTRICRNNFTNFDMSKTGEKLLESVPIPIVLASGTPTINVTTVGECASITLDRNITPVISAGHYVGQTLTLLLTQDVTGSRTVTWPSNFKKAGGTLTVSTAANTVDKIIMQYDGTNWLEVARHLNLS